MGFSHGIRYMKKYECGHSWWLCDTSLYQSSTFSMEGHAKYETEEEEGMEGKKTCGKTLPFNRKNCVCRHNCMYINRVEHVDHPTKTNDQTNKSGKFFFENLSFKSS